MGDVDALEDYLSSVSTQGLAIPYNLTDDYIVILIGCCLSVVCSTNKTM